ncbi:MAG: DJ-1/PfpI family protein [Vicinamibacterales bacterium]
MSEKGGAVRSVQGVDVMAQYSFTTAPPLDILMMVPGGVGTLTELGNNVLLDYLKTQNARTQVTTSVCTGSALLAKTGMLKGHKATSNKNFFTMAVDQDPSVDWVVKARWVDDSKFVTSSGVSAGTDMALGLVMKLFGKARAQQLARSLEYEWHDDPTVDPFALKEVPSQPHGDSACHRQPRNDRWPLASCATASIVALTAERLASTAVADRIGGAGNENGPSGARHAFLQECARTRI